MLLLREGEGRERGGRGEGEALLLLKVFKFVPATYSIMHEIECGEPLNNRSLAPIVRCHHHYIFILEILISELRINGVLLGELVEVQSVIHRCVVDSHHDHNLLDGRR